MDQQKTLHEAQIRALQKQVAELKADLHLLRAELGKTHRYAGRNKLRETAAEVDIIPSSKEVRACYKCSSTESTQVIFVQGLGITWICEECKKLL